jgi:hypothetical protein
MEREWLGYVLYGFWSFFLLRLRGQEAEFFVKVNASLSRRVAIN